MAPSPFRDVKSDGLSFAVTPLEMLFKGDRFAHGTGFFWRQNETFWLVSNWHNFSGLNPFDGTHLNPQATVPDAIRIFPCTLTALANGQTEIRRTPMVLPLFDDFHAPHWIQHRAFEATRCDLALLKLAPISEAFLHIDQFEYRRCLPTLVLICSSLAIPLAIILMTQLQFLFGKEALSLQSLYLGGKEDQRS